MTAMTTKPTRDSEREAAAPVTSADFVIGAHTSNPSMACFLGRHDECTSSTCACGHHVGEAGVL